MQSTAKQAPNQPPVKIYNAVYSSVQVYECMIRGIAVMRRRGDSYVNATQILKVAGVDKGRRTKILEKEILPGKHEIVQGGYGKYQGTWIPLERGRDIAMQYGVAPLLAPLFDFTPSTSSLGALPVSAPNAPPGAGNYMSNMQGLAPAPIMPGSALRLLNQGRAQGLFTPSTSSLAINRPGYQSPGGTGYILSGSPFSTSQTPPPGSTQTLKRNWSETDVELSAPYSDVQMMDGTRAASAGPPANGTLLEVDGPSPSKRARKEPSPLSGHPSFTNPDFNPTRPSSTASTSKPKSPPPPPDSKRHPRFATRPSIPRHLDPTLPLKDTRRAAVIAAICQADEPSAVLNILREVSPFASQTNNQPPPHPEGPPPAYDIDAILDDQGHTALHIASSLSRLNTVQSLISLGADVHRGNHLGETPLIRTVLSTHSFDAQSLPNLLSVGLSQSIMTLDTSKKTVLHHIVLLAGVKGRAVVARYYLDQIFYWIANEEGGDFARIVDLQDEHGDTALNIAARVGSRTLVRTLVDVGANKVLMNKLGLRPGDFGVESEELAGGPKPEDIIAMLRSVPSAPIQKSQDVIADMTAVIQGLSTEFQSEIKVKQDALDVTQAHLRAATRELSEQRKQIQTWQGRCTELDMVAQRKRNVDKAIEDEDSFDWTGRWRRTRNIDGDNGAPPAPAVPVPAESGEADASGEDDEELPLAIKPLMKYSPAFQYRGAASTIVGMSSTSSDMLSTFSVDPDPPVPATNDVAALIRLRRMKMWYTRIEELMEERIKGLHGASAEKEYMCRKIVALCTGVPVDKVEEMLENLLIAVESESQTVDIGRVSGFMQKVRDGIV